MDVQNPSSSHLEGTILAKIGSPADLHGLSDSQLEQLTQEMRDELVRVLRIRPAHFASNLGWLSSAWHFTSAMIFPRTG